MTVTPVISALATGALVAGVEAGSGLADVAPSLVALGGSVLIGLAAGSLAGLFGASAVRAIDGSARSRVRAVALAPTGIAHLAEPDFADTAVRASDRGEVWRVRSPGTASVGQVTLSFRLTAALGAAAVLAVYFPWLALALLTSSLLLRGIIRRQWIYLARCNDRTVGAVRRTQYWTDLAGGAAAAKEIRLFGLADWVVSRRLAEQRSWSVPASRRTRWVLRRQVLTSVLAAGSALAAMLVPGLAALSGEIGLAAVATCLVAAWEIFRISAMGHEAFDIEYGIGAVHALEQLTERYGRPALKQAPPGPAGDIPRIEFRDVAFAYPGIGTPVLHGLTLDIRPGQVLAIVGVNGAGKSTLIKLLAGLYRPTAGKILADGRDLAEWDIDAWRRRLAVVVQDFIQYPADVRDNIRMSAPEVPADDADITAALRRAGAEEVVAGLPDGLATPLWRNSGGGVDLSGGQWQKLAIARSLYAVDHGRKVLILDEPTAHLDVQAEADFYQQAVAAARGASVVLISHRLSTVRSADAIAVLDGGKVAELGSHEELMARDGIYAELFKLQAAHFAAVR
ncbi:ABC transporter ATP-binding protein [Nonomuraea sp. NPDC050786]|uniref:ABC transporter ATP-binding protein n=1 Tax=Nonomuraea sp. NPDC050786 TaxID=3154840 RepID=UPI0033FF3F68